MWSCVSVKRRRKLLKPRVIFLITGVVVVLFTYVIASCPNIFLDADQPLCQISEHLAVVVASSLRRHNLQKVFVPPSNAPAMGQATVFYVWCGARRRPFQFRNYLSVRSALRTLRPDAVWFYYESEPTIDDKFYNTWWNELVAEFPFFHGRRLQDVGGQLPRTACDGPGRPSANFVRALVTRRGGTFVDETTVIVSRPPDDKVTVAVDFEDISNIRLMQSLKPHYGIFPSHTVSRSGNVTSPPSERQVIRCPSDSQLDDPTSALCVHITRQLYPKDIWTSDGSADRLLRREFYGRPDPIRPSPLFDRLAPNVGHVIWVGGGKIDFLFFLCVLSLLHVVKVDVVYVHGDRPPTGVYWNLLSDTRQQVEFVLRENAREVLCHVFVNIHVKILQLVSYKRLF